MDFVVLAVSLDGALFQKARGAVRPAKAANVEGPQIHARIAVDNPIGHGFARASRCGDARGEATGNEDVIEFRRQSHDGFAIG